MSHKDIVVKVPGRINLMGEHTADNRGLALTVAIDRYLEIRVRKRSDKRLILNSAAFGKTETELDDLALTNETWSVYIQRVCAILGSWGYPLNGFELEISGNLPPDAGLGSSAALCCGTVMALAELFELDLNLPEMAKAAVKFRMNPVINIRFPGVQVLIKIQIAGLHI